MRFGIVLSLACLGSVVVWRGGVAEEPGHGSRRYALLVGCTKYFSLPTAKHLAGPANDVELMAQTLVDRFGFRPDRIVKLSEKQPDSRHRPRRANIVRELERLVQTVREGDMVVILLAGHGAQQPDDDPDNPRDVELDGLDELFLPADIGPWDEGVGKVENAITDDELGQWLEAIRRKGAFVWLIADTCHSGTITRGLTGPRELAPEVARELAPGELVPVEVIERARREGQMRRGGRRGGAVERPDEADLAGIVALYAAQSYETAPELPFPEDAPDREYHGLLTYTLCRILQAARSPMTYRELADSPGVHALRPSPADTAVGRDRLGAPSAWQPGWPLPLAAERAACVPARWPTWGKQSSGICGGSWRRSAAKRGCAESVRGDAGSY